jgi:tRNA(Ile)-lysidine synthase
MGEGAARICFNLDLAASTLNRRLNPTSPAPLIVAFSGGGDSLALLLAAKAWADGAHRRVIAVTVDHRLQAAGAGWAAWCEARCKRLGVAHRTLAWTGDKPATGLAAAARAARHGLIADAARDAGASVILMGHTADDRLEARLMRAAGASVPDPREWSPSPLWPKGRGLFILRPLIEARRAAIRRALTAAGETWIEDPANIDPRQSRARARAALVGGGEPGPLAETPNAAMLDQVAEGPAGDLTLPRAAPRALVGAALLCAAGTARPPRADRLDRLMDRLAADAPFVATLAGARAEAAGPLIHIQREAGDFRRAGGGSTPLVVDAPLVWDGRFEITAHVPGLAIAALAGRAARLDGAHREALRRVRPSARPTLPALIDNEGAVACPILVPDPRVTIRSLVSPRLSAALGAVNCEAALGRVAKTLATT